MADSKYVAGLGLSGLSGLTSFSIIDIIF